MTGRRRQRGIITVFVTLMMVPVVVITSIMVDLARVKSYSSQAVMAADSYGEAVLSEYDNLLKELYGLFSVTQNEEGLAAVEQMKEYAKNSFDPSSGSRGLSGFMPYKGADVDVVYEKIDGASLDNNNVLMTQISDFMKYRIVEEVFDDDSILKTLSEFDEVSADMDVMKDRNEITDSSQKVLEEIDNYYRALEKINDYPGFIKIEEERFAGYSSKLTEIAAGQDYADYVYYLQNKEACDEALEKRERIENSDDEDEEEELTEEEEELADLAERISDYGSTISGDAGPLKDAAWNYTNTGKLTDYEAVLRQISDLETSTNKIDGNLTKLNNQVTQLKVKLESCSEDMKEKVGEEIKDLEEILKHADDFRETFDLIEPVHHDFQKSQDNKKKMDDELTALDDVLENLVTGNIQPGDSYWSSTISFDWYSFRENKDQFYRDLQKICGSEGTGGDKDAGKKKQDEADKARKEAEKALSDENDPTTARDIPDSLADQMKVSGAAEGAVPGISSYFSSGLSFDALGMAGNSIIDRFLVTSYDFGMFSSRVSGKKPEGESDPADAEAVYYDESLTGYKISENINYLYGAELEYLLGGHNKSKDNLNETRNIICGVRLTMNFISTYKIDEINTAINTIARAAADAVALSGVGAAVAPLVRVAVSGALRAALSTMETAEDWTNLKNREKVVFLKSDIKQLEALDSIRGLLEGKVSGTTEKSDRGLQLSYEDYLYVLLCLMLDGDTLMSRTSNLITLNVNQAQNPGDTLTSLKFKMADTVTAIESTCKVKMDFAVLPKSFMELYLSGTSAEAKIKILEDEYFGYSIIRGY